MKLRVLLLVFLGLILFSCASKKDLIYFQNINTIQTNQSAETYEPKLQQDDMLMIIISSAEPEAAIPYNLPAVAVLQNGANAAGQLQFQTYLIDNNGNIEFPVLGTIKLAGLTRTQAVDKIKTMLGKYIKDPIVNFRITNYKVSIIGEVNRPGVINLQTERVTLPEALAQAGDLTIFGNRKNILVIRESTGVKTYNFVDITKVGFVDSPFYYLDQNDVVYVEPNQTRINSSVIGPDIAVIFSALSVLLTVAALLIR